MIGYLNLIKRKENQSKDKSVISKEVAVIHITGRC